MLRLASIAFLFLLTVPAAAATKIIRNDGGGVIVKYIKNYQLDAQKGTKFRISGRCASACTMITGIIPRDRVCVSEKATLGFHSGYIPILFWTWHSKPATQLMWSYYPLDVQAALVAAHWNGAIGQRQREMIYFKASAFYPLCGAKGSV